MKPLPAKLPRTVWRLGLASFFTDVSSEMVYPLLPVFLKSVLQASVLELGIIEGIAESTASLLKVFSGRWTDVSGKRKKYIVVGYSLSSVFRPCIGLATSWGAVLGLRFLDRVGKGIRTSPRDALIADVTPKEHRGAAYGLHRAMDHAGAVFGPLVAGALLFLPGITLQHIFFFAGIPAALAILVLVFGLEETPSKRSTDAKPTSFFSDFKILNRDFKIFLFSLSLFALGNSTDAFLLVKLSGAGLSGGWIAILWSMHHVVKMTGTYYGGKLADRVGHSKMIIAGWIFYAAVYLAFAFVESKGWLVGVFLVYGMYFGLIEPAERAIVVSLVPKHLRGTALGLFHFAVGIGILPASILFGVIAKYSGTMAAFIFGSTCALLATAVLLSIHGKLRRI